MIQDVRIADLQFGANYRAQFDPAALSDLAENMRDNGQLSPIIVRPLDNGRYELLAGERRTRAKRTPKRAKIEAAIAFWAAAAQKWQDMGRYAEARECRGALAALQMVYDSI